MKKEMKRTLGIVLSAVTVLSIGATSVFAAGSRNGRSNNDADGVCDNRDTAKCQNAGQVNGNFIDEDNDGVCDNRGTGKGCGKGYCSK